MSYETVGMCMGGNLQILGVAGAVRPENQAMWNLSNALLHLSMAVESDLGQIRREIQALEQQVECLSRQR